MRTISLLGSIALLALAACTTETTPASSLSHPTTGGDDTGDTDPGTDVGSTDTSGEHGVAQPAGATSTPSGGTTVQSDTWTGTKDVPANITIAAGQTVTISPGTTVTMGANVAITVLGTLKVDAATSHVKMTGASWQGLVIGPGGTLAADGLEMTGPASAIWTQKGNAGASLKDGVITAQTPFKMEAGSTLTVDHTNVTATAGSSIAGTFTATFLNYNKGGAPGLTLNDPLGTMSLTDSAFTGSGGNDYLISDAGHLVSIAYSTVSGSHCGFHFGAVDSFTIDHVSDQGNSYGAMLYGSKNGGTITSSNFRTNSTVDIDFTKSANGTVTIDKSFLTAPTGITPTNMASAAIADAQPRTE